MEPCCNSYAVVAYLRNDVGNWINTVRREFVPGCPHLAHITLLPPRPLELPARQAASELHDLLAGVNPISISFGCVDKFESTQVVKLSLQEGTAELVDLHQRLNRGALEFADQYEYVPHVTIGHELPGDLVDVAFDRACEEWDCWGTSREMTIDTLTLVQQAADGHWIDLEDFRLMAPVPVPVRVRRSA